VGIRFVSVLPRLTPATELGSTAVAAYARRDGVDIDEYLVRFLLETVSGETHDGDVLTIVPDRGPTSST
jgi:hypothetical protein